MRPIPALLATAIASSIWTCLASGAPLDTGHLPERSLHSTQVMADDGAWSLAPTVGDPTVGCYISLPQWSVRDSKRSRMIVMISDGTNASLQSLALDTYQWSLLSPAGAPPSGWSGQSAIYDPVGDRVLVFGGNTSAGLVNQVWALELAGAPQWVQVVPSGAPPSARQGACAIFDTRRQRMIVAGGSSASASLQDVWALDLTLEPRWSQLFPTGTPPSPLNGGAVYDEVGDRMLRYGTSLSILSLGDSPAWSAAPGVGGYGSVSLHYDGARHRLVALQSAQLYDVFHYWAFDLGSLAWTELHPNGTLPALAKSTGSLAQIFDPSRDRLVCFGLIGYTGLGQCQSTNRSYLWSFGGGVASVDPGSGPLGRSTVLSIGPSPGSAVQMITLRIAPGDASGSLEIYSLDGRRVWQSSLAGRGAGVHTLSWDGRTIWGTRARPGIYLARLAGSGARSSRRFVRL